MINNILKKRIKTSIALFVLVYLMIVYKFISTYVLIVFGVLSLIEFFQISNKIFNKKYLRYFINLIFIIYLSVFCFFFHFIFKPNLFKGSSLYSSIWLCCIRHRGVYFW